MLDEFRDAKREIVRRWLVENEWNVAKTARAAGCNRAYLHKVIAQLGVSRPVPTRRTNRGNAEWRALT